MHLPSTIDARLGKDTLASNIRLIVSQAPFVVNLRIALNVACLGPIGIGVEFAELFLVYQLLTTLVEVRVNIHFAHVDFAHLFVCGAELLLKSRVGDQLFTLIRHILTLHDFDRIGSLLSLLQIPVDVTIFRNDIKVPAIQLRGRLRGMQKRRLGVLRVVLETLPARALGHAPGRAALRALHTDPPLLLLRLDHRGAVLRFVWNSFLLLTLEHAIVLRLIHFEGRLKHRYRLAFTINIALLIHSLLRVLLILATRMLRVRYLFEGEEANRGHRWLLQVLLEHVIIVANKANGLALSPLSI